RDAPHRSSVAALDVKVRVGRLLEGDVVGDEVVRVGDLDKPWRSGDVSGEISAAVDDARTHDEGVVAGNADQIGFAGVSVIALERNALVDDQTCAGDAELRRVKGVVRTAGREFHALAGARAGGQRGLNA